MSALYDGQAQGAELDLAVRACSSDPEVMRAWQDWHLIGDVMRSQDLAPARGRDEAFLERLRAELAREPIVLAPLVSTGTAAPAHMPPRRVPRLRSALAVAAASARGRIDAAEEARLTKLLLEAPRLISGALALEDQIRALAPELAKARDVLYFGRGVM